MRGCLFLAILLTVNCISAATSEATYGSKGMVTSRSTLASEVGVQIMRDGGNAVDAAVATAFALAVTYPSAGNIGGGGFALIRFPDGRVFSQDHREIAPAAAYRDMYLDDDGNIVPGLSVKTHLASGVPGSVDGLLDMLQRYGELDRKKVLAPAIALARDGFVLNYYLAEHINKRREDMQSIPASIKKFSIDGKAMSEGGRWRQPDLAATLERIAELGRDGFYAGETADLIVAEMQRGNGLINHEDLASYHSVWRAPVHGSYRGYDVYSMGPPSSGGILIMQVLNMLEPYNLSELGWGSAALTHLVIEAERRAYADRAQFLGDPDFVEMPVSELISKDYAQRRFSNLDPSKASDSNTINPGSPTGEESRQTTHFSVMDGSGMMVSLTTTLNSSYGNKIVVPGTGILLNNEMNDFSSKPNTENQFKLIGREANAIAPRKRMLSSMSPTIITKNGTPVLITGSPGGATIITTTLQVIMNIVDHKMTIEEAVARPRFHHQWKPNMILYERFAFSPDTLKLLQSMGHEKFIPYPYGRGIGDANSILFKNGMIHGVKDPRNEGTAVGF